MKSGANMESKKTGFEQILTVCLAVYDLLAVNSAFFFALWLRFDCRFSAIPETYLGVFLRFAPVYSAACILIFWGLRLYKSIWRFASYNEVIRIVAATVLTALVQLVGSVAVVQISGLEDFSRMPISYYIVGILLQFFAVLAVRFGYRLVLMVKKWQMDANALVTGNVLLIGAGTAGQMILRDLNGRKNATDRVRCIIDDNPGKWGRYIDGIPVVGGRDSILECVEAFHISKIYLAIPSATVEQKRDILNICKETGCELKTMPGMYQYVDGKVTVSAMKDVAVEDLLGRKPITVDMAEIFDYLRHKTILVTGGGGSIGSELCRQIASHDPKKLIIFDIYENNAYEIEQELKKNYPQLDLVVLIGSVRDSRRIHNVFQTYKPDVVYHAAAHKHVPLMEHSACEAIKNNTIGTYKTAYAAMCSGCKRFVLISTDKAVNPTNIMGASKRLCEMVIQTFDRFVKEGRADRLPKLFTHAVDAEDVTIGSIPRDAQTEFVAVRFGNVLGSNGSVIPLFKKQIAAGGPVTVTHPDIIRYFMTIPEAVSLVLQAGVYAQGGEIFVLDMGEPVKIDTLARNLIKLSGLKPDVDIKIAYTGLRPGEKLYEEKLMEEEGLGTTPNHLIHIGKPIGFDADRFLEQLETLMHACSEEREDVRRLVAEVVQTYTVAEKAAENEQKTLV